MQKAILKMKESLEEGCYIALISANEDFDFGIRKSDDIEFLDSKTLFIQRESGRTTIINLNLIIGICIRMELM